MTLFLTSAAARGRRLLAWAASALLLAACGGGTSQIEPFVPTRVLVFGDELSSFTADGRKHAINGLATDGVTRDCKTLPLWMQLVVGAYGSGFPECPVGTGAQIGSTRAAVGAKVAEVTAQIDAQVAAGGFTSDDLAMVWVGLNDVLELYGRFPATPRADLIEEARQRGVRIAGQVNRLVDLGAKVIIITMPDVGVTPFALAQKAANTDTDRAALLSELSAAVNGRIRTNILNDGRFVGLVLADEYMQSAARQPSLFGLLNVKDRACKTENPLPDCSSATLVSGAGPETWLWADDYRLATAGHRRVGNLAEARARNNPF
jgi:outer membrane lipase/esterase